MQSILIGAGVAIVGLAHAVAAWLYFSREPYGWIWAAAWILATVGTLWAAAAAPWLAYGMFALLVALWTAWWVAIRPSATLDWLEENRFQATGTIIGSRLTVQHVRDFDWLDKRRFDARWENRTWDLDKLEAVDLFVCTWGSDRIAHTMVSFVFTDAPPLCFSIETRREAGERWTAFAGLMKSYELIVIAGDERDLVRSRVNVRGEDVRLYRVYATHAMRLRILAFYVAQMNRLARRPRFYNTVLHNCTTEIARIVWAAGHRFPLDWRLLVSGYIAEYLYEIELLDRSLPLSELKANADIRTRSLAADAAPDYWRRIRVGLADPHVPRAAGPTT